MKSKGIFTRILSAILCAIIIIGMVPVAIAAEGEALALNVVEALPEGILSRTYGKDLSITWGAYYGRGGGVKGAIDGNAVYSTANDGWQPDTTWPKITINNLEVPKGAKKLILNAKIYSSDVASSIANNIIINGTILSVSLRAASEVVAPIEIDLTSLGDISTISSMVIHPFVIRGGEMRNVEVRFESIEFSSDEVEVQDPNTIYGKDLIVSWGTYYGPGNGGVKGAIDGNAMYSTAKNDWKNNGCADYTIKNIPVPAGAKYLTLNIKTLSNDKKTTTANVTIDGTVFDANFFKSSQKVAPFTFDLTDLGTITTISNMKIVSFANKAQLKQTEVRIESIVFSEEAPEEAESNVVYGKDILFGLGSMYDGLDSIIYEGNTAIIPAGKKDTQSENYHNDDCALITAKGLTFPATNKYIVVGITTDVDNASRPGARPSSTKNVEIYVDEVSTGYNDVDLASYEGQNVFAHVIDASSKITSGTTITHVRFDPIPNSNKGATEGDLTRFGKNGNFRVDFIAAFATLDEANKYAADYNAPKLAKVTLSATEGGSVDKTGGAYAVGSTVTFTATPDEGYKFDGWYVDGANEVVSTSLSYTLTVESATSIEARFIKDINKTNVKLSVVNGKDETLGSFEVTGNIVGDNYVAGGDNYVAGGEAVKITATPKEKVGVFGYWRRFVSTSGLSVYLGINTTIDAYALGVDWQYQPVFFAKAAEGGQQVQQTIYVDATNLILSDNGEVPAAPSKPGYEFTRWKERENNGVVTVMEPVYKVNDSTNSTLTVIAADGGTKIHTPYFNEVVTVDAGADNVVWTLTVGDETYPVSYNREYSFRYRITAATATLTATAANESPKALVSGIEAVHADAATRFIGSYYVPESYKVTGYGMLLTSDEAVADSMILDTDGVIVGNLATASNDDSMMFVVNKNKTLIKDGEYTTWYGRAFLIYTDAEGESHVIYGETISK